MDESVLSKDRVCVTGLTGCGKSSGVFEILKETVTYDNPVLFVYQTYSLMKEQIKNWSKNYGIKESDFIVCGHSDSQRKDYSEIFTNPELPENIPDNARFVFYSQSYLQRCRHKELLFDRPSARFSRIILDEFDYTKSIIPTLDYQFSRIVDIDLTKGNEKVFEKWIKDHYSNFDVVKLRKLKYEHQDGFFLAHWLSSSEIPVMFLTAEEISSRLLKSIGFDIYHHGVTEFSDCLINIEPASYINNVFFEKMNIDKIWATFPYDYIITNKVDSHYQNSTSVLERPVAVPHITAKGSNEYRGSKILTIISHIPDKAIRKIKDAFNSFGDNLTFDETKALYYKSVMMQSIGRVIGYRGSKSTDVIVHADIWNTIKNNVTLPYSVNDNFVLDFEGKQDVVTYIDVVKKENKVKEEKRAKQIVSYGMLKKHFKKDQDSTLTVNEVSNYLKVHKISNKSGTGTLPVSKLALFFDVELKVKKINGKSQRCIVGINFK